MDKKLVLTVSLLLHNSAVNIYVPLYVCHLLTFPQGALTLRRHFHKGIHTLLQWHSLTLKPDLLCNLAEVFNFPEPLVFESVPYAAEGDCKKFLSLQFYICLHSTVREGWLILFLLQGTMNNLNNAGKIWGIKSKRAQFITCVYRMNIKFSMLFLMNKNDWLLEMINITLMSLPVILLNIFCLLMYQYFVTVHLTIGKKWQ